MSDSIADFAIQCMRQRTAMLERLAFASLMDARKPGIRVVERTWTVEMALDPTVPFLHIYEHQMPISLDELNGSGNDAPVFRVVWLDEVHWQ